MASRPRGRHRKNNHAPGNTRTDAALDAMRPYGFDERLVRETVKELLDVYEGTQGWPFIEEASYKLLIETMLSKQQISSEGKDNNARREGETVTSVAPSTCANSEAGSSNLAAQDSLFVADPQTSDAQVSASLDRVASTQFQAEPENERISVDNAIGSNNRNVDAKKVRHPVIRSSQPCVNVPTEICKPCYGWIENDIDDGVSTQFQVRAENKKMPVDKSIERNIRNVDAKQVRPPVIQSSQPRDNYPIKRHKPSYGRIESDIYDEVSTHFRVEAENKRMSVDKSIGSKHIKNVDAKQVRPPVIQSSQPRDYISMKKHKPSYGRIESDTNDAVPTQFRVEAKNKRMSVDKSIGSNIRNVDAKQVRLPVQSSQPRDYVPVKRHKSSYGRIESDINDEDSTQFRVEAENKRMSVDKSIGSKHTKNVDAKQVGPPVIQSSQPRDNVRIKRHEPSYGRIESDISDEVPTQFQVEAEKKRMSVDKSIRSNIRNVDAKQVRLPVIQSSQPHGDVNIKRHKLCDGRIESDINDEVSIQFLVEAENKRMCVDKSIGSNIKNVYAKQMRPPMLQHSQRRDNVPIKRHKPCYGWISSDTSDEDLTRFPLPSLPEELIKSLRQNGAPKSGRRQRRKSRWDEKPDDVIS